MEHVIERSVLLAEGEMIDQIDLPFENKDKSSVSVSEQITIETIDENERSHILKTLKHCKGRIAGAGGAAELLGVPPSTLHTKMTRLGIRREHLS